jgi:hypothetical protein
LIVVWREAVEEKDGTSSNTRYWLGKTFVHAEFKSAGIEGVEIRIKRCIALGERVEKSEFDKVRKLVERNTR